MLPSSFKRSNPRPLSLTVQGRACAAVVLACSAAFFVASAAPARQTSNDAPALVGAVGTLREDLVIRVPEDRKTLQEAIDFIGARIIVGAPTITIQLSDGQYGTPERPLGQIFITDPKFQFVRVTGNCGRPGSVTLNFQARENLSGFALYHGGRIGLIDCLVINGIGARQDRSTWHEQSYGSGVQANGSGSSATLGSKLTINDFYYGAGAFYGGSLTGRGVTVNNSGDANYIAGWHGVLTCIGCSGNTASHIFTNAWGWQESLGFNFIAEMGSTLHVDGSKGTDAQEGAVAAQTNGSAWAHDFEGSGAVVAGARVIQNGYVELNRAKLHGNGVGVKLVSGGAVNLSGAELSGNKFDGVLARGGHATGDRVQIRNNGGFGIRVERNGSVDFTGTEPLVQNNGSGRYFVEQGAGCRSTDEPCRPPAALMIR
jgi:hypothetical protein